MRALVGTALGLGAITVVVIGSARADLENHVFTSRGDNIRIVVPRGWRESDAPSYPNVLLWMMRADSKIVLTAEPLTHALYCTWPVQCRASHDISTLTGRYACALRDTLQRDHHMHVSLVQGGPKENEDVGLTSVWFEYDDGHHFMRQAVALGDNRAVSLVLASSSNDQRASAVRSFEQALRTLRPLSTEELAAPQLGGGSAAIDGGGIVVDAAPTDAGSVSAPASVPAVAKVDPVGPCS
jgi:hypothetical protein